MKTFNLTPSVVRFRAIVFVTGLLIVSIRGHSKNTIKLLIADTRSDTISPLDYSRVILAPHKHYFFLGLSSISTNYMALSLHGWVDDLDEPSHRLIFSNTNDIFLRKGYSAGWRDSQKSLTENSVKALANENFLIGKIVQISSAYKLDLSGAIQPDKVIVNTLREDYVFDTAQFQLPLDSLHPYILNNHHLPGIPSSSALNTTGMIVSYANALISKDQKIDSV